LLLIEVQAVIEPRVKKSISWPPKGSTCLTVLEEMDFLGSDVRSVSKGKPLDLSVCYRISGTNSNASGIS
jgi:hypothetical protein